LNIRVNGDLHYLQAVAQFIKKGTKLRFTFNEDDHPQTTDKMGDPWGEEGMTNRQLAAMLSVGGGALPPRPALRQFKKQYEEKIKKLVKNTVYPRIHGRFAGSLDIADNEFIDKISSGVRAMWEEFVFTNSIKPDDAIWTKKFKKSKNTGPWYEDENLVHAFEGEEVPWK
jgi:hypothetical protein